MLLLILFEDEEETERKKARGAAMRATRRSLKLLVGSLSTKHGHLLRGLNWVTDLVSKLEGEPQRRRETVTSFRLPSMKGNLDASTTLGAD